MQIPRNVNDCDPRIFFEIEDRLQLFGRQPFDGALRAHGHKGRHVDRPMRRDEAAQPGRTGSVAMTNLEGEAGRHGKSAK